MQRDTTNVPTDSDCYQIINDRTLLSYKEGIREDYTLVSNTWVKVSDSIEDPDENINCLTSTEVVNLQSPYDFMTPIFETLAIVSAIAIFYFAYKLIIYPFFRKY